MPSTHTADALIEGLSRPTGSVPNGPTLPRPVTLGRARPARSGPVQIARPGVPWWSCDYCRARNRRGHSGHGTDELLEHFERTGHRVYTPRQLG